MPGLVKLADDFREQQKIVVLATNEIKQPIIQKTLHGLFGELFGQSFNNETIRNSNNSLKVKALAQAHVMNDKGKYDNDLLKSNWDGYLEKVTEQNGFPTLILRNAFHELMH